MTLSGRFIVAVAAVALVAGCSSDAEFVNPPPAGDELGDGPGLLSGSDGGFYIVGGPKKKKKYGR